MTKGEVDYNDELFVTSCVWRITFGNDSFILVLGDGLEEAINHFWIGLKETDVEMSPYNIAKVEIVGALNDFWNAGSH